MSNNTWTGVSLVDKKTNRTKAFCYDQGITTEEMDTVWENAVKSGNPVINQLVRSGCTWHDLNNHLLQKIYNQFKDGSDE